MEILGVGPSELIFIIIIAIIVLGPKDMQKAGRTLGRWLNQLRTSDGWKVFQATSRELRNLPTKLMREANLDEIDKDIRDIDPRPKSPASSSRHNLPPPQKADSTPQPDSTETNG
jgi:sec-independent protein translocase protein TatB